MRKHLIVVALILSSTGIVSGQSDKAPARKQQPAPQQQPAPVVMNTPDKQPDSGADQPKPNSNPPAGNAPIEGAKIRWSDPNFLLVIVGIITAGFIGWQSWETRKAAKSSSESLAFQKESLRPRLRITKFKGNPFHEALQGEYVVIKMDISNSGGLPAYGIVADAWIEFIHGVPPYVFTPAAKYARAEHTLDVHTSNPSGFQIPFNRRLTEEERNIMAQAKGAICFRVRLMYRAFDKDAHTDASYEVGPDGMMQSGDTNSET